MAGCKDDHDNADGEGHSRKMIVVADMLAVPFCPDNRRESVGVQVAYIDRSPIESSESKVNRAPA